MKLSLFRLLMSAALCVVGLTLMTQRLSAIPPSCCGSSDCQSYINPSNQCVPPDESGCTDVVDGVPLDTCCTGTICEG